MLGINTKKITQSFGFKIFAVYIIIAIVNITFFIIIVFENKVALITDNVKAKSEIMISSVINSLKKYSTSMNSGEMFRASNDKQRIDQLNALLKPLLKNYLIFTEKGEILYKSKKNLVQPSSYVQDGLRSVTDRTFTGSDYFIRADDKDLQLYFYIPLSDFGLKEKILFTSINIQKIDNYKKLLYSQSILIILFTIFIHALFSLFIYKSILKPVKRLERGSKRISDGNLSARVNLDRDDELGSLAKSFNLMAESVEKSNSEITLKSNELKKAYDKLKDLDRLKTNFFTNISHEIRNPLTLILSPIESALQNNLEGVDKDFFENLRGNSVRLLRLINNLLDYSKIESGKMNLLIQKLDVVKLLKDHVNSVKPSANLKEIDIKFKSDCDELDIYVDLEKIDKIMMNLISNSLKFTGKGGKILVEVTSDDKNIIIKVEDNGPGIPEGLVESIFDRFVRIESNHGERQIGSGIGLALTKELVEIMGGVITLKSNHVKKFPDNHGTTFLMELPYGKEFYEEKENVTFVSNVSELDVKISEYNYLGFEGVIINKKNEKKTVQASKFKGKMQPSVDDRILIVEDNPDMLNFIRSLLEPDYIIYTATNGLEGLEKTKELKPDLIISDVMMPEMDGFEMTRLLKKDRNLRIIPIILITARADIETKIEGFEYGADDYVTKPFNSQELVARIRSLLKTYEFEKILAERNREIEQELEIARLLQQKILPQETPKTPGFQSHVTYVPVDMVGGDFYDIGQFDSCLEMLIADVSGHGLPGAFLATVTKMAMEGVQEKDSTNKVLGVVNKVVYNKTVKNNYVTAFYSMVDTKTNIMRYSNAGHFPPFIYRRETDEFITLEAGGKPLGWLKTIELKEKTIQLKSGDRIILYTDGVTETTNYKREEFGIDRLKKFIRKNSARAPRSFSNRLLDHLRDFSGSEKFDDDLCMIVVDVM